jgi:hypothetical protein
VAKKKLIVVWPYRFRDFDWQRFELEQLSQHVEVHVHELIDALTPEFAAAYANQSDRPEVKRFGSLKEWRREFKKVSKDSIVFTHVRPINFKSFLVCLTVRSANPKTVGFLLGGAVVPDIAKNLLANAVGSKLKNFYHFLRRNLLTIAMPSFVAVAGTETEQRARRDFSRNTKPIQMGSFDYSQFLLIHKSSELVSDSAVYLDTGFPGFPRDEVLTGHTELISAKDWYPNLGKFFSFVETTLQYKVDVAVHPKHVGRDHSSLFGNRACLGGQTAALVAERKLVIATNSTAISFAVCFDKPLILVWSDLIASGVDVRKKSFIENFAHETGAKIFNIDREYTEKDLRDALVIDHAKRESYKRKYLTSRTDDKPNYQVLLDEVISAVDQRR